MTDSGSFPIGLTTTRIGEDNEGEPSVTAIFTNIADQKQIEALHLRAERLEAVAELSASLAHEIRNPLASIRSSIEQLSRSARADEDERFLAQLVLRESDRLNRLLTEFLDFARVQVTQSRPLDIGEIVEAAVEIVRQHPDCPDTAQIEIRRDPAPIEGDEDLLHRIVVNLVLNALQASDGLARVTIEVRTAGTLEIPAGLIDEGETPLQTADRECREEIGMKPERLEPLCCFHHSVGFSTGKIHIVLADKLTPVPQPQSDPTEILEPVTLDLEVFYEMIAKGEIVDSKSIVAGLWYRQMQTTS